MNTPVESKSQDRALTTTSFAILSILAIRDHSTYDLTRQLRISLHYLWPRAESNVYAEPPRLVAAGLAEAREEWRGQRRRTIYSITDAGRGALAEWLASPSGRSRYESEALMKVLFAENGTRDDLLRAIEALAVEAAGGVAHFRAVADRYASGQGDYPARFGISALAARLLMEQAAATLRWAAWANAVVSGWETPLDEGAGWGVEVLRQGGQPFALDHDPVAAVVDAPPKAAP